ncbi:MAG: DUF1778 domain-containing protein [Actinobacteria bacterium]|nr:DUF1778 domain-containing protein [Actinomycetota bacterium]
MKTERIEVRLEPEAAERIREAAALGNGSVSTFVVAAAADRAERVLAEHRQTEVPGAYFDALLSALDEGSVIPRLEKAAAKAARSVTPR